MSFERVGSVIAMCLVACFSACQSREKENAFDAGISSDGSIGFDSGVVDLSPSEIVIVLKAYASTDAGLDAASTEILSTSVANSAELSLIEPTQHFELVANTGLINHRVRLFDEADRVVVSDDRSTSTKTSTSYDILTAEPLTPGFRYSVVLDAQSGAQALDGAGRPISDQRFEFKIAGEKPVVAKPKLKKKK